MPIRRARSIDELYDAVSDYDLVLTTDAPLSLALNRRIDRPRLGRFAATPRMLASGEFRPRDDRHLFFELIDRTDLGWKHADYVLEHIFGCWEEMGRLDAILEFDQFDTQAIRDAIAVIEDSHSAHRELATYSIDEELNVAVIGADQFTALDRTVLPSTYDDISPFSSGAFALPPFCVFDSKTAIVDTVVDNITQSNASNIAIVMDRGSEYPTLVESALRANAIPFHGGPGIVDDENVRTCLRLLRAAQAGSHVRLADVRPILSHVGVTVPVTDDNKFLHELDHPALDRIQRFCDSVSNRTFADTIATVEAWGDCSLDAFRDELDRLNLCEEHVTESTLDALEFYLHSFDVPIERDVTGVLLADATAAAYVDRSVVFYLGMDIGWTHRIPNRPWIDAEAKDRGHLEQFQVLLQNGTDQYFLVQETTGGKSVTPCLYFHDLLDDTFETFGDLPNDDYTRFRRDENVGFTRESIDAETTTVDTLSQSGLNTFVNCPRDYVFDELVDGPDRDYFTKGNLYHDFAEFYVNHPEFVSDLDRGDVIAVMLDQMRPYYDEIALDVLATEFAIGIELIVEFIDHSPPTDRAYDSYERSDSSNFFADHFDRPLDSTITEQRFENRELGGRGKVDLIHSPARLVDYKSGRRTSASGIVSRSSIEPTHDEPNFQAMMYLAHHRTERPEAHLEFVFVHFLELVDDVITGAYDLEHALVRIPYHPVSFQEYAPSRDAFDALCDRVSETNARRKTLESMGYEEYATVFAGHSIPDTTDVAELLDSDFAIHFTDHAIAVVGDYVYVKDGIESALKNLVRLRRRMYFADDVDAFEAFLDDHIDRINVYRREGFPVGIPNVDRLNNPDLIRTDD